jgi:hypothetical protein
VAALILSLLLAMTSFVAGLGHTNMAVSHHVSQQTDGSPQQGTNGGGPPGIDGGGPTQGTNGGGPPGIDGGGPTQGTNGGGPPGTDGGGPTQGTNGGGPPG